MSTPPERPDRATSAVIFAELLKSLPRPAVDTPEGRTARDNVAMDAVCALNPDNAFEARLAANIVAAEHNALDCYRRAAECHDDVKGAMQALAMAASTLRQMRALLREYRRMQAERDEAFAKTHPAAMERAGYWYREVADPPPPAPVPAPAAAPQPVPEPAATGRFETMTPGEQYAALYPGRVREIRARGGLPERPTYGPPDPEVLEELIHGTSPLLRALDPLPEALAAD